MPKKNNLNDKQRRSLEKNIKEVDQLIRNYENQFILSNDPKERERCQKELKLLKKQRGDFQREYANSSSSQASLEPLAKTYSFPEHWLRNLPYPLAAACADFNLAGDVTARFLSLDHLLANTVKYLASIVLSCYRNNNPERSQLSKWFTYLSSRRIHDWQFVLDDMISYYSEVEDSATEVMRAVFSQYQRPLTSISVIEIAYQKIHELRQIDLGEKPLSIQSFLQAVIEYRMYTWEVSTIPLTAKLRNSLVHWLQPALKEILSLLPFIQDYPLRYIERVQKSDNGWLYEMSDWCGSQDISETVVDFALKSISLQSPFKEHRLYLCTMDGKPILNVYPLLAQYKKRLYFLETYDKDETLILRPCRFGKIEPLPIGQYDSFRVMFGLPIEKEDAGKVLEQIEIQVADADVPITKNTSEWTSVQIGDIFRRLSPEVRGALGIGLGESLRIGQFWLGVEFMLMGLSKVENSTLSKSLIEFGVEGGDLRGVLRGLVQIKNNDWRKQRNVQELGEEALQQLNDFIPSQYSSMYSLGTLPRFVITPRLLSVLRESAAGVGKENQISDIQVLLTILRPEHNQCLAVKQMLNLVAKTGKNPDDWIREIILENGNVADQSAEINIQNKKINPIQTPKGKGILGQLGRDLSALAQSGQLRPAIGESARKVMTQIGLILLQTQSNNPLILGDSGVGKTAIVEGLAWRLANDKEISENLANLRIIDLSTTALMAGTKHRGDLEDKIQQLLSEVRSAGRQVIIFIDEIHTILGGKSDGSQSAFAEALKPALARGEFPCIGATTVGEYRRYIEGDPALARRFTPVWLEEPSSDEAFLIAKRVAQEHLSPSHAVEYSDDAIAEAVRLSIRYIHDEFLPGKVIKILDQAGPRTKMGGSLRRFPLDIDQKTNSISMVEVIREIVAERTGIPLASLSISDRTKLLGIEDELKKRVRGQEKTISELARVVKRTRAGLSDPRRPQGVFLFAGPTGVGKTELALALTETLFNEEDAILRLDMSEYMEKHQISRLIGSPPGYVGYEEEGQLTGYLRRHPYSVILLDEFEKAHKDVQNLFLQLFDVGRMTDSRGHVVDGRNAIFIMTTNLGAKEALGFSSDIRSYEEKLQNSIEGYFTSEFLGRVNYVAYFRPLTDDLLLEIFDKFLLQSVKRFEEQGVEITVSDTFKRDLCKRFSDMKRGARPLQRAIDDEIIAPLTDKLLNGEIRSGMKIVLDLDEKKQKNAHDKAFRLGDEKNPDYVQPHNISSETDDKSNLEILSSLLRKMIDECRDFQIDFVLSDGASEILCSSIWEAARDNLPTEDAFEKFVHGPIKEKIDLGEIKPGDRVIVYRNIDTISIKKEGKYYE